MKKPVKILLFVMCAVFAGVFIFSGYKLYNIMHGYKQAEKTYNNLSEQFVSKGTGAVSTPVIRPHAPDQESEEETGPVLDDEISPIQVDFEGLLKTSSDVVGWIYSPNTVINYPVVIAEDNDYYLHAYIDGEYNPGGSIFVDCLCNRDFSSRNTIVYGHHMNDGSMFASLRDYRFEGYYEKHPIMYLNTPSMNYRVEIFAFYLTDADSDTYDVGFSSEEEFNAFIAKMKSQSDFPTEVEVKPTDNIVTLSTCSYEYYDARYVVQGRLVPIH